jgi:Flp pilus assembly protein TadD
VESTAVASVLARIEEYSADAELFQLLGRLLTKEGRFKEARVAYDRALELDPTDPFITCIWGIGSTLNAGTNPH